MAQFPRTQVRFRNDDVLHQLGVDPQAVADHHLEETYGRFVAMAISSVSTTLASGMVAASSTASCMTAIMMIPDLGTKGSISYGY